MADLRCKNILLLTSLFLAIPEIFKINVCALKYSLQNDFPTCLNSSSQQSCELVAPYSHLPRIVIS